MTNTKNKASIKEYFKSKNYFDYGDNNVFFFSQELGPLFNEAGQIALKEEGEIFMVGQGNGMVFWEMKNKKILEHFEAKNIKYLFMGPCNNLLLKVADPTSLGYLIQ